MLVEGYFEGSLIYTQTVSTSATEPTFYTFDFENVDQVIFTSSPTSQFALDNLTINEATTGSVIPEPSSALALAALLGAGLVTRSRRR